MCALIGAVVLIVIEILSFIIFCIISVLCGIAGCFFSSCFIRIRNDLLDFINLADLVNIICVVQISKIVKIFFRFFGKRRELLILKRIMLKLVHHGILQPEDLILERCEEIARTLCKRGLIIKEQRLILCGIVLCGLCLLRIADNGLFFGSRLLCFRLIVKVLIKVDAVVVDLDLEFFLFRLFFGFRYDGLCFRFSRFLFGFIVFILVVIVFVLVVIILVLVVIILVLVVIVLVLVVIIFVLVVIILVLVVIVFVLVVIIFVLVVIVLVLVVIVLVLVVIVLVLVIIVLVLVVFGFIIIRKRRIDDRIEFLIRFLLDALCFFKLFRGFRLFDSQLLRCIFIRFGIRIVIFLRLRILVRSLLGLAHQVDRAVLDLKIGLAEIQT